MKYVMLILDGAAAACETGEPTPLEASSTPNLDALARAGRVGAVSPVPEGWECSAETAVLTLLGYDPRRHHPGHAALRAAALGIDADAGDRLLAVRLVETGREGAAGGVLFDRTLDPISEQEAGALFADLFAFWRRRVPEPMSHMSLRADSSCDALLIDSSRRDYARLTTVPPRAVHGRAWAKNLPTGTGETPALLHALINLSAEFLPTHEVNRVRAEQGLRTASLAWIFGDGPPFAPARFDERFGVRGCMIAAGGTIRGIARRAGLHCPEERPASPADAARLVAAAIKQHELICCHLSIADQQDEARGAIEAIDREFVAPVGAALRAYGNPEREPSREGWRVLVVPTPGPRAEPDEAEPTMAPFVVAGAWVRSLVERRVTERDAAKSDLHVREGHHLMEYFLRGGLATVRGGQ